MKEEICKYCDKSTCLLSREKCKEKTAEKCKVYKRLKQNKDNPQELYEKEIVICKDCGEVTAIRFVGTFYQTGLPERVIDKQPKIYGKYYNREHMFSAVGFGGTIPYRCTKCGREGLIDEALETYECQFSTKPKD